MNWTFGAAGFVVVGVAVAASLWRSYRRAHPSSEGPPPGFARTAERFVDPTTGLEQVVWFNPQTGERRYQPLPVADRPSRTRR